MNKATNKINKFVTLTMLTVYKDPLYIKIYFFIYRFILKKYI